MCLPNSSITTSHGYFKSSVPISSRSRRWYKINPLKNPSQSKSEGSMDRFYPVEGFTWQVQSSSLGKWKFGRFSSCHPWTTHSQSPGWRILRVAQHWQWGLTVPTWLPSAEQLQPLLWSLRNSHPGGQCEDTLDIHVTLLISSLCKTCFPNYQSNPGSFKKIQILKYYVWEVKFPKTSHVFT